MTKEFTEKDKLLAQDNIVGILTDLIKITKELRKDHLEENDLYWVHYYDYRILHLTDLLKDYKNKHQINR